MSRAAAFFFFLVFAAVAARADLTLTPRFEAIQGKDEAMADRAMLKTKFSSNFGKFSVFAEGFVEGDAAKAAEARRTKSDAALQEAYLELKQNAFFIRAGKQALRWSDMWVLPSLDIWTARRWNRLLFDPQPEQFIHSAGMSFTYATNGLSLESFITDDPARDEFPQPLPVNIDAKANELSGGARLKVDAGGFSFGVLGAKVGFKNWAGASVNYAFESVVPKLEVGGYQDRSVDAVAVASGASDHQNFAALGADVFMGNWTFQPQATYFDFGDLAKNTRDFQSIYYLSGTWQNDKHDFQFQTFGNTSSSDFFFGTQYGYNFKDWMTGTVFAQYYYGDDGGLITLFHQLTGGWVGGIRLEFNISI